MQRRWLPIVALAMVTSAVMSCSDDDSVTAPTSPYKDLTLRDHVLVNLEVSYNQRNLEHYQELLDTDFVFHFSPTDIALGYVDDDSWDGPSDADATRHVFDPAYSGPGIDPIEKIHFELVYAYEPGNDGWTPVTPSDQEKYAGEIWYQKAAVYFWEVNAGDMSYIGHDIPAVVLVRPVVVDDHQEWRMVSWSDSPADSYDGSAASSASEKATLGRVKSVYCRDCRYRELTERDEVLSNLEAACNERNIERYNELLDNDFVFHFSIADVENGSVQVSSWGRAAEIASARNMFDPNFSKPGVNPVSDIELRLVYAAGDDPWTPITPSDPERYPGETWYEKVVTYYLTVTAGDMQFICMDVNASFVVRWASVGDKQYWRIVVWRDDTGTRLGWLPGSQQPTAVVPILTWGRVKDVFGG